MPGAKKRAKNEDFQKRKLKVGKKKAMPDNYTDTSFTSKSISLPNQSITEDKSRELTTSRNLTLTDLLTQAKHHNANVRKDALAGMQELCATHPGMLSASLGTVVQGIVRLFIDDDRDVRKALYSFLQATFVDVSKVELQPFLPLLLNYTCSAMTHILEDIRMDAIKLVDVWAMVAPEVTVTKFWIRITGNYMSLLSVDASGITSSSSSSSLRGGNNALTAASVKAAAAKSHLHIHKGKVDLFTSLTKLLEAGLVENKQDRFWFMLNSLESRHSRDDFKARFEQGASERGVVTSWKKSEVTPIVHPMLQSAVPYLAQKTHIQGLSRLHLFELAGPKNQSSTSTTDARHSQSSDYSLEERLADVHTLIDSFLPITVKAWLEAAPSVFSSSNSISMSPALQTLHIVLKLSLVLWRAAVSAGAVRQVTQAWLSQHLQQLLKHALVYFPYGADTFGHRGTKVDSLLQEMNFMTCELTSLFLLARAMVKDASEGHVIPTWSDKIVDHVLGVLGYEEEASPNTHGMTTMSASFKSEDLTALLPALWGFLNCLDDERQLALFKAFMDYHEKCHAHSASKRIALEFIARIYLIQSMPDYTGQLRLEKGTEAAALMRRWLQGLPKMLWELRTSHVETSRTILNAMCDIAKRGDKDIFDVKTLCDTEQRLVPFFIVNVASKGMVYGPYRQLPVDVQKRALEFVYYVNSGSTKMADALQQMPDIGYAVQKTSMHV